jgi:hypothetical protein
MGMAAGQSSGSLEGVDYLHVEVDAVNSGLTRTQELQTVAKSRDYKDNLVDAVQIGFNPSKQNKQYPQSVKKQRENPLSQHNMKVEILDEHQLVTPMTNASALSFKQKQAMEKDSPGYNDPQSQLKQNNQPMLLDGYQYGGDDDDPEDDES